MTVASSLCYFPGCRKDSKCRCDLCLASIHATLDLLPMGSAIPPVESDMDMKVKATIKLIEEDADSVARRAEMYSKKQPELMKLVEELEISNSQNEFKKLSDEMLREAAKWSAEEFSQSLQLGLDKLGQKAKVQQQELIQKQDELEKLIISLEDAHKRCLKAEMALQSMEKLHCQSQEEVKILGLEIQKGIEKLKDMECSNEGLKEEVDKLKEENDSLNEQNLSSAFKIKDLEDEIITLKESKRMLEMALWSMETQSQDMVKRLGLEIQKGIKELKEMEQSNMALQEEVHKVKEENDILNKQNLSSAAKIKDLQDEINETKGTLDHEVDVHVEEKKVLQQELCHLEEDRTGLVQRNEGLEKQIKAVTVNAESLQELIRKLKEENDLLNKQNLSSTAKIKDLQDEIICLNEAKRTLDHEVDLHIEENKALQQELCHLKEDRSDLEQRNKQLTEQMKVVSVNAESLQELVKELENGNTELREICKKHVVEKELISEKIKHMEQLLEKNVFLENSLLGSSVELEVLRQKMMLLSEHNEKLKEGIYQVVKTLYITKEVGYVDGISCEVVLQNIMGDMRRLLNFISDAENENQRLSIELSVLVTLPKQMGTDLADMRWEKYVIEQGLQIRTAELLTLQNKKHELLEMNEKLRQTLVAGSQREEVLKSEMDILYGGSELLKLIITKVEALEQVTIDTGSLLQQEKFASGSSLEAARKEIEELKPTAVQGEVQEDSIRQPNEDEDIDDSEFSKVKYAQETKDIQLDQVHTPNPGANMRPYACAAAVRSPRFLPVLATLCKSFLVNSLKFLVKILN